MSIKTIQVADKTTLDAINTLLTNGTYGLSALNKDLDSVISSLGNGTYGLSALKTAISGVSSSGGGGILQYLLNILQLLGEKKVLYIPHYKLNIRHMEHNLFQVQV